MTRLIKAERLMARVLSGPMFQKPAPKGMQTRMLATPQAMMAGLLSSDPVKAVANPISSRI